MKYEYADCSYSTNSRKAFNTHLNHKNHLAKQASAQLPPSEAAASSLDGVQHIHAKKRSAEAAFDTENEEPEHELGRSPARFTTELSDTSPQPQHNPPSQGVDSDATASTSSTRSPSRAAKSSSGTARESDGPSSQYVQAAECQPQHADHAECDDSADLLGREVAVDFSGDSAGTSVSEEEGEGEEEEGVDTEAEEDLNNPDSPLHMSADDAKLA